MGILSFSDSKYRECTALCYGMYSIMLRNVQNYATECTELCYGMYSIMLRNVQHYAIRRCRNKILKYLKRSVPSRDTKFSSSVEEELSMLEY